jgi:hypothetical protein
MNGEEGRSTRGLRSLSSFFSRESLSSLVGSVDKGEVRYFYPRDPQGRFSHGEGGDPEVKRRKIDAAVREAHRRILDNPDDMGRAVYDAAADQGLSGHDAQEVFQLVDQKMRKEAEALAKSGTSGGAKLGWETRRGGGSSPEDNPSNLMSPQLEDVVRRGYVTEGVVDDPGLTTTEGAKVIIVRKKDGSSASYLSLLPPTKQDPNWTVGSGATAKSERKKGLWSAITSEAAAFAQSQGTSLGSGQIVSQENKAFWEKLTSAGKAVRQDEHHYVFVGDAPKPEKADKTLDKAGTSDGAKLGWETRRHGSADVAPEVPQLIAGGNAEHFSILRAGVEEMIAQEVEDLNREAENHRKRIPSDYAGMTRGLAERGRRGFAALQDVRARLNGLQPSSEEDKVLLGRMLGYVEAKIVGSRHGEFDVGERFRSLLSDAANLSGKLEREASMARKSIREILDDARSEALAKEGTSDGAVRGWETRRSGAAPVEETPKKGQDYLKQMGRRLSTAQDVSGRMKRILDSGKKITDVMDKKEIEVYSDSLRGALADAENVFTRVKNPSDTVYENLGYARGSFNEADKKPSEERAAMLSELWRPVYNLYRQGMELAEQGWDEKKNKSITKEGTSEGAKKGWETRRGDAPDEPKGGKTYEVIYRPRGKGTWGEVRQVTVPPREDEPKPEDESELHRRNASGYLASAKAIEQKLKGLGHTFSHRIFSSYSGIGADEANKLRAELEMNRTAHRAATQGKAVTMEELREAVAAVSPEVAAAYERHFGSKKEKAREDLRIVVRPPIPSKRGENRNVMSPTGEN